MKKRNFSVFLASVMFVLLVLITQTQADPAIVSLEGKCVGLDTLGNPYDLPDVHIVQTSDKSGNITLHCHGKLPADAVLPETKAEMLDDETTGGNFGTGLLCNLGNGVFTIDWQQIVTKSGRVDLHCQLNSSS